MNNQDQAAADEFLSKNSELEFQSDCLKSFLAGIAHERARNEADVAELLEALNDIIIHGNARPAEELYDLIDVALAKFKKRNGCV